ncbi:STAS domain-containing protein [Spirillospora sp. NPDC000708]|jgi:anti-sigma B factor antagonist|uniref:STAS domain-containing protein n=1 Tax=Actinomadura TaxID=1988 RepID=UPI00168278EB|nr:STAS domain-containing protein [Actinomadura sp. RB99]MBD2899558.1 putative anti-sigma factor antagonist [Actinomadura sp. RB99]
MGAAEGAQRGGASFDVAEHEGWTVVTVEGELDLGTAGTLDEHLSKAIGAEERPRIVVDVTRMTFCDSSGLNVLIRASKRIAALQGRFVLVRPTERVRNVLRVTGLERVFDIRDEPPEPV